MKRIVDSICGFIDRLDLLDLAGLIITTALAVTLVICAIRITEVPFHP